MLIKRKFKTKKGLLDIPFTWLFAIIAGAVILFLAIYISAKIIKIEPYRINTELAKQIGILTNPFETSYEMSSSPIYLGTETRFYNEECESGSKTAGNYFGNQKIKVSQKTLSRWPEPGGAVSFPNKYFFSESMIEGKKFYVFSKGFYFPYKIADLTMFISAEQEYCFVSAPESVKETIEGFGKDNLKLKDCGVNAKKICFNSGSGCYANVIYSDGQGYVEKNGKKLYFTRDYSDYPTEESALMYAAIFSYPTLYECQLKRLMNRAEALAEIYYDKAQILRQRQCDSAISGELTSAIANFKNYRNSGDIIYLHQQINMLGARNNDNIDCKLW